MVLCLVYGEDSTYKASAMGCMEALGFCGGHWILWPAHIMDVSNNVLQDIAHPD